MMFSAGAFKYYFKITMISFIVSMAFVCQALAYEPHEGNIAASFGPTYYKTNFGDSAAGPNKRFSGGYGLEVLGDINDKSSLELDIFHLDKTFFRHSDYRLIAEKTDVLHITMGYRRWINWFLSVGLGLYSAYSMGDYATVYTDIPAGIDIDTSARDTTEYGLDFSVQSDLGNIEKFGIYLDLRYSMSMTSKANESSDHYGAFLGFRYLMQVKKPSPTGLSPNQ